MSPFTRSMRLPNTEVNRKLSVKGYLQGPEPVLQAFFTALTFDSFNPQVPRTHP